MLVDIDPSLNVNRKKEIPHLMAIAWLLRLFPEPAGSVHESWPTFVGILTGISEIALVWLHAVSAVTRAVNPITAMHALKSLTIPRRLVSSKCTVV